MAEADGCCEADKYLCTGEPCRIQDTLDFANGQNKQLQEQTQVLEKQLASAQARYAATTKVSSQTSNPLKTQLF